MWKLPVLILFLILSSSAPRPNVYVYCCPVHINFDQKTCVWVARFARAILGTIDTTLAVSVKNDLLVYLVCMCDYCELYVLLVVWSFIVC